VGALGLGPEYIPPIYSRDGIATQPQWLAYSLPSTHSAVGLQFSGEWGYSDMNVIQDIEELEEDPSPTPFPVPSWSPPYLPATSRIKC
jgi:hypothetical protein